MKLEDQVVSLELAKKLKELGVEQESLWGWVRSHHAKDEYKLWTSGQSEGFINDTFSAFTVAELGEMLPEEIEVNEVSCFISISRGLHSFWMIGYRPNGSSWVKYTHEADTEADARAKMLIYLIENKLITV